MRVAYISGKYRDASIRKIVENIRAAEAVALEYWKRGFAVICPHTNSALLDGACVDEVWLEGDLELVRRSDLIVMLPSWITSVGARGELREAVRRGLDVIFEDPDDPEGQELFADICDEVVLENHESETHDQKTSRGT